MQNIAKYEITVFLAICPDDDAFHVRVYAILFYTYG
jgi:hypothetical protein